MREIIEARFANKDYAYVAYDDSGQIIGALWLLDSEEELLQQKLLFQDFDQLPKQVVNLFVVPNLGKKSVGTRLLKFAVEQASDEGVKTIISAIDSRNKASIRVHEKTGFFVYAAWKQKTVMGVTRRYYSLV